MTEKSKHLLRSWTSWITGFVIIVLARRGSENPVKTTTDVLAALFVLLLCVAYLGTARLANDPVYAQQRQGTRFVDLLLLLILFGAGYAMVAWGVQGSHGMPFTLGSVPILIGVAFNLGRWRGQQDNRVRLSESPHEIWAR